MNGGKQRKGEADQGAMVTRRRKQWQLMARFPWCRRLAPRAWSASSSDIPCRASHNHRIISEREPQVGHHGAKVHGGIPLVCTQCNHQRISPKVNHKFAAVERFMEVRAAHI